jgi:hypothetical protein
MIHTATGSDPDLAMTVEKTEAPPAPPHPLEAVVAEVKKILAEGIHDSRQKNSRGGPHVLCQAAEFAHERILKFERGEG